MARMKYREQNQVKWIGMRPGHNGTQITKEVAASGVGIVNLYTVPIAHTLYLTYALLTSRENVAAGAVVALKVQPIGEVDQIQILIHYYDIAGQQVSTATFNPPIEVAAGIILDLNINHANIDAHTVIHGWIEA